MLQVIVLEMTSGPRNGFKDPGEVEKQYVKTCRKLTEAEVNSAMFNKMIKSKVATNDARHFSVKQAKMKRVNQKLNTKLSSNIMRLKLNDACATASRLRIEKKRLKDILTS